MFLTDFDKTQLRQQIRDVESTTDAEIVTVVANASDSYTYIPVLWAALLSLCLPGIYYLIVEVGFNGWVPAEDILRSLRLVYIAQVLLFLTLLVLFQWQPLQMRLIPTSVKRQRAHRHAQMQFVQQRLHWSSKRSGILLFVSIAEHYVEIIADKAIASKVEDEVWAEAIQHFTDNVKRGRVAAGFSAAIDDCRGILQQHFPGSNDDPKMQQGELPNHLIEV